MVVLQAVAGTVESMDRKTRWVGVGVAVDARGRLRQVCAVRAHGRSRSRAALIGWPSSPRFDRRSHVQTPHSWGEGAHYGRPTIAQRTESCFISPEAGVLAGIAGGRADEAIGSGLAWQSPHADGCARPRLSRDVWRSPG